MPYPAACRPQAWAAAASISLLRDLLGLDVDVPGGRIRLRPMQGAPVGALGVRGLAVAGRSFDVDVDRVGGLVRTTSVAGLRLD